MKRKKVHCNQCNKEEEVYNSRAKEYKYCSKECMAKAYSKIQGYKIGNRINNWEIIDDIPIRKFGRSYIKVKCTCGSNIEKNIPSKHFQTNLSRGCEMCSRFHTSTGIGLIGGDYWSSIKNGAEKRKLEFTITIDYAWNLFQTQKGICAISGLIIEFNKSSTHVYKKDNRVLKTASLDRINSKLGYIEGNVQWVHKDINLMKNKFDNEYFIKICKQITENNENKNKEITS